MKKIKLFSIILSTVIVLIFFTACTYSDTKSTSNDMTVCNSINGNSISLNIETLISEYCNEKWDGTLIFGDNHCASIENGKLWIDCKDTDIIPDINNYYKSESCEIVNSNFDGTWIYNNKISILELWKKGNCIKKLNIYTDYPKYTNIYLLKDVIIANCGQTLQIYDYDSNLIISYFNIIDCYKSEKCIFFSTFRHDNYKINESGEITKLDTKFVRFARDNTNFYFNKDFNLILNNTYDLYHNTEWNGNFRKINNYLVMIDEHGYVIVNNKIIGNILLKDYLFSDSVSYNIKVYNNSIYWLDGDNLVITNNVDQTLIDIPNGNAEFLYISDDEIIVNIYGKETNCVAIIKDNNYKIISSSSLDAYVSSNSLFYLENDNVYCYNFTKSNAVPELYFAGAFAIAHFDKENCGAIVPNSDANNEAYGYKNLYTKKM